MKILLVGDYSGVHSELKKIFEKYGHDCTVISEGDGYKSFSSDIFIQKKTRSRLLNMLLEFSGFRGLLSSFNFVKNCKLGNFDVVQFINPIAINSFGPLGNIILFYFFKKRSNKILICALGDDLFYCLSCLSSKLFNTPFSYSPFDNLGFKNFHLYYSNLKYVLHPLYVLNNYLLFKSVFKVIPGLIDYSISHKLSVNDIIPLPFLGEAYSPEKITKRKKVFILHPWQTSKEFHKGNLIFDKAIILLTEMGYGHLFEYKILSGVSNEVFLSEISNCDIVLDQVYSHDYGMTGVLGLFYGKVVFSGFSSHSCFSDKLSTNVKTIGVDTPQCEYQIASILLAFLNSPDLLNKISCAAFQHFEEHHSSSKICNMYFRLYD